MGDQHTITAHTPWHTKSRKTREMKTQVFSKEYKKDVDENRKAVNKQKKDVGHVVI